jgi:hypothetical protein
MEHTEIHEKAEKIAIDVYEWLPEEYTCVLAKNIADKAYDMAYECMDNGDTMYVTFLKTHELVLELIEEQSFLGE